MRRRSSVITVDRQVTSATNVLSCIQRKQPKYKWLLLLQVSLPWKALLLQFLLLLRLRQLLRVFQFSP